MKSQQFGERVHFSELGEGTPRFVVTDLRTQMRWYAHRPRYAKKYAGGLSERGASLAASYGLQNGDLTLGGVTIDCGAHYGDLLLWIRETCGDRSSRYVGVEPDPEAFACLSLNAAGSFDRAINVALSDRRSTRVFYIESTGANSSLERPATPPSMSKFIDAWNLDGLVRDLGLSGHEIDLLKLEAEGHEPEVLLGAKETLAHVRLIAADLGPERGPNAEVTAPAVMNHLFASGFRIRRAGGDRGSLRFLFENSRFFAD